MFGARAREWCHLNSRQAQTTRNSDYFEFFEKKLNGFPFKTPKDIGNMINVSLTWGCYLTGGFTKHSSSRMEYFCFQLSFTSPEIHPSSVASYSRKLWKIMAVMISIHFSIPYWCYTFIVTSILLYWCYNYSYCRWQCGVNHTGPTTRSSSNCSCHRHGTEPQQ